MSLIEQIQQTIYESAYPNDVLVILVGERTYRQLEHEAKDSLIITAAPSALNTPYKLMGHEVHRFPIVVDGCGFIIMPQREWTVLKRTIQQGRLR